MNKFNPGDLVNSRHVTILRPSLAKNMSHVVNDNLEPGPVFCCAATIWHGDDYAYFVIHPHLLGWMHEHEDDERIEI